MAERSLVVNFIGNDAQMQAALKRTAAGLNGMQTAGARMTSVGKSLTRNVTLPIVGLGVAAADMAMKFQASMETLHTQAGVSQKAVGSLSTAVLKMAGQVGVAPEELAAGMYHVASSLNATLPAVSRQATELKILRIAAEGARTGHADLVDVTNALDAAVVSGIKGVHNFSQAMGNMNATVGAGDMTMQDLADAFGTGLLAPMKRYGLTLQEVDGALAVFGDNNIRGAEAGTKLSSAIRIMAAPSIAASKALASIGLGSLTLANDLRQPNGLVVAFGDLQKHLQDSGDSASKQAQVITRAFGGRQSQGVQILLNQLGRLKAKTDEAGAGAQNFGKDWSATQQTAAQKTADALATMKSDLTQFGEDVLPTLLSVGQTVVTDVDKVAQAFEGLPKGAQTAIIDGGLLLASIGPALRILGLFTSGLGQLWAISAKLAGLKTIAPAVGGGALGSRSVSSSVGSMSVGTLVVRSMVGGTAGVPGVTGAAKTAVGSTAAEATIVEQSLLSRMRSGLGSVLSGGLRGLMIGGVGTLLSDAVGSAIQGSVGSAVKSIGSDAAIGGGMGAFFGPAGIAGGAIIGGLVGTFEHFIGNNAEAEGKAWADKFVKSLPGPIPAALKKALASGAAPGAAPPGPTSKAPVTLGPSLPIPGEQGNPFVVLNAWSRAFIHFVQFARDQGTDAGNAFTKSMSSVKFPTAPAILGQMQDALRRVPESIRQSGAIAVQNWRDTAAQQMVAYATSLEQHGKLPKGAVDNMIASLERSFPGLTSYLDISGQQSEAVVAKAMSLTQARSNWTAALNNFRSQWDFSWQFAKTTNANIYANTKTAMSDLRNIIATGTGSQRAAAKKELDVMQSQSEKAFSAMADNVAAKQAAMTRSIALGSQQAASQAGRNLQGYEQNVYNAMSAGLLTSNQGASLITKALNATLKAFGAKLIPLPSSVGGLSAPGKALHAGTNAAHGALVQFGRAGARGPDDIPINFGGHPIRVGSGEVGAVFNGDQQRELNAELSHRGGLRGFFSGKRWRAHNMAGGGMVPGFAGGGFFPDPGTNYTVGEEPTIAARLNALGIALGIHLEGLSGYRSPSHSVAVGGFANDPHTQGRASDTPGVEGVPESVLERFGLTRPFGGAAEADHIQLLAGAVGAAIGKVSGVGVAAQVWKALAAPAVKGSGTIADLVRAAMSKETSAANKYGQAHMPTGGNVGGTGNVTAANLATIAKGLGYAWDASQISNWLTIIAQESGGSPTAQNPTSTAYGIGQFLDSTWGLYGTSAKTSDAHLQLVDMAKYIHGKYGTPAAAEAFHLANNSYARGGMLSFAVGGPVVTGAQTEKGSQGAKPQTLADRQAAKSIMQRLWAAGHKYYPRSSATLPPTIMAGGTQPFVGDAYDPNHPSSKNREVLWPDWMTKMTLGKKGPAGPGGLRGRNGALETMIHEWAHQYQSNDLIVNGRPWEVEGGAQSFAREMAPKIIGAAGIKGFSLESAGSDVYYQYVQAVRKQFGEDWIRKGQFTDNSIPYNKFHTKARQGFAGGGALPFAGSFGGGGTIPGPLGKPALAVVHGGEFVDSTGTGGNVIKNPAVQALTGALEAKLKAWLAGFAGVPSQGIAGQLQLATLANKLTIAQNAGSNQGQQKALLGELALEKSWLAADKTKLKRVNAALNKKGLGRKQRATLLADKLGLLQEIGTVEGSIGSASSALASTYSTGSPESTDGSSASTTSADAQTAAIQAQTQTMTDLQASLDQTRAYMQSAGSVEASQAIKALSDVISGQIGGQYISRSTGSAGDGSVARYGSVGRA